MFRIHGIPVIRITKFALEHELIKFHWLVSIKSSVEVCCLFGFSVAVNLQQVSHYLPIRPRVYLLLVDLTVVYQH